MAGKHVRCGCAHAIGYGSGRCRKGAAPVLDINDVRGIRCINSSGGGAIEKTESQLKKPHRRQSLVSKLRNGSLLDRREAPPAAISG